MKMGEEKNEWNEKGEEEKKWVKREDKSRGEGSWVLSAFAHPTVDEIALFCLAMHAVTAICLALGSARVINLHVRVCVCT